MRVARQGWREHLWSFFYVYPFRCQLCGHRFKFRQWGVTYVRVPEDRRDYKRLPLMCPVTYSGENIEGAGTAADISINGCAFDANHEIAVGTLLRMTVQFSKELLPVVVDTAVVRSAEDKRMGVEFLRIQPGERERLQVFMRDHLVSRRN